MSLVTNGSWVGGAWVVSDNDRDKKTITNYSPFNLRQVSCTFSFSYSLVDAACKAAVRAKTWQTSNLEVREEFLVKFKAKWIKHQESLRAVLQAELGLSKNEINDMNEATERFLEYWRLQIKSQSPDFNRNPFGVAAVICGFSDAWMLALERIIPALLSKNTVIYKPSEKTPLLGGLVAQILAECDLPEGVFNMLLGDSELGRRLILSREVGIVLFAGSNESGVRIQQDLFGQPAKKVVLQMGSKNGAYIDEGVVFDEPFWAQIMRGAYWSANQRCSSLSWIFVHSTEYEKFLSEFHKRSKAFDIGQDELNLILPPLIDSTSVDRFLKFIGMASREGLELKMRGKRLDEGTCFVAPCIAATPDVTLDKFSKSVFYQSEFLSPLITVIGVTGPDQAIDYINSAQYCLASGCFSKNEKVIRFWIQNIHTPQVNLNSWRLSYDPSIEFLGLKKSGNHQAFGSHAIKQLTYSQSSFR